MRTSQRGDAQVVLDQIPSFLFTGAWLSPGTLLLSSRAGQYAVPLQGGRPALMEREHLWPQVLPGKGGILFVEWDGAMRRYRARLQGPGEKGQVHDPLWTDSRVQYADSAKRPREGSLFRVQGGNLLAQRFNPQTLKLDAETEFVAEKVYSFGATGAADFVVSRNGVVAYMNHVSRSRLVIVDRTGRAVGGSAPPG